MHKAF